MSCLSSLALRLVVVTLGLLFATALANANNTFPGTTISGSSGTLSVSNVGATSETGEPTTYGGGTVNSMWYSWTAPGNGAFTIETCSNTATNFDTTLQTFTGTAVNALTQLATNDDTAGCLITTGQAYGSRNTVQVTSGTTYRIQLDGYGSATGTARLAWNFVGFTISKSASVASVSAPGTITYTIAIANRGTAALTGTSITDSLTLGASARTLTSGPTLTSGDSNGNSQIDTTETWTYTATYVVPQSDIDLGGTYSNTATYDTTQTNAYVSNAATTSITQSPSFTNVKSLFSGPSPVTAAGQTLTYRISIANSGNVTLTGPTLVSDTFQMGGSSRTLSSGPSYTSGDSDSDGAIDVGETWIYTATYLTTQADIDGTGSFTNLANYDTTQTAPVTSNTVTTAVTRTPNFTISKSQSGGPSPVTSAGQTMTYTITVANTGNQSLTSPSISDTLVLGASSRTLSTGPTLASGDSAPLGTLNVGETWTYTATYVTTQADIDATGSFSNTASFTTAQVGPKTSAAATTNVTRSPSFTNVKSQSGGPNPITAAGQVINYTITVDNTGNQTLTGPSMTDQLLLGAASRSLSSGPSYASGDTDGDGQIDTDEVWIYTASYTVTQPDLDATGNFSNTATFDTAQTSPLASNAVLTGVTRTAMLSLSKDWSFANSGDDADGDGFADVGDLVTYTYTVTNTGNVTVSGVHINDTHMGHGMLSSIAPASVASLAPTVSTQFTATYVAVQGDIDNP